MKPKFYISIIFCLIILFQLNNIYGQNIGIGTTNPTSKLEIQGDNNSTSTGIKVKINYSGESDIKAIESYSVPESGWGFGGQFTGGYMGIKGIADAGTYSNIAYGVYGIANGSAGIRYGGYFQANSPGPQTNYGIYAAAANGSTSWAGFFNGNVNISGQLKIVDENQGTGKVLLSDADGLASWGTMPNDGDWSISGDDIYSVLTSNGKVGIGIAAPMVKTHIVKNTGQGYPTYTSGTLLAVQQNSTGNWAHIAITAATDGAASLKLGDVNDDDSGSISYHNGDNSMRFFTNGNEQMRILNNGNLGLGINNPDQKLVVYEGIIKHLDDLGYFWNVYIDFAQDYVFNFGEGNVSPYISWSDGSYNQNSDARLKKDIETISPVLSNILLLTPVKYRFKSSKGNVPLTYGFIAQEVQKLFPQIVKEKKGYLSLNYSAFGVLAIKAIQEQQEQIITLKNENQELKNKLSDFEQRLEQLENK